MQTWLERITRLRLEAGLSVVLALQACIMFVVGPLAATGHLTPAAVDTSRFGLAAAAVLMLTRSRAAALLIVATFLASLLLSLVLRVGSSQSTVYLSGSR